MSDEPNVSTTLNSYPADTQAGIRALARRRAEYIFAETGAARPPAVIKRDILASAPPPHQPPAASPPATHTPSELFPTAITAIPVLILEAGSRNQGGAIRAWTLARALDQARLRSGTVEAADLRAYCEFLGIHPRTSRRWITAAVQAGLLIPYHRARSGVDGYRYVGPHRAAVLVACPRLGNRPVEVDARQLVQKGWRSIVWGGFIAALGDRPASREKKRQLTGVPKQTQLHLETRIPVEKTPNYVVTDLPVSHLDGVREHYKRHAFPFHKSNGQTVVAWRGPDACSVPPHVAKSLTKGRLRKAKKRLNAESHAVWLNVEPALSEDEVNTGKLFFATPDDAEQRIRKLTHPHAPALEIEEVFVAIPPGMLLPPRSHPKARFWRPVRILDR